MHHQRQHQGKSSYNGEVGARNLLLEEQICSGKDKNANLKSIHLSLSLERFGHL